MKLTSPCRVSTVAHLAQTVERPPFKRMVVGSIPTVGVSGRVAQMVEHESNKLRVQGSIPCVTNLFVPVAKWIRRRFPEPKIVGSSPTRDVRDWSSGHDVCLTRRRSRVQSSGLVLVPELPNIC